MDKTRSEQNHKEQRFKIASLTASTTVSQKPKFLVVILCANLKKGDIQEDLQTVVY